MKSIRGIKLQFSFRALLWHGRFQICFLPVWAKKTTVRTFALEANLAVLQEVGVWVCLLLRYHDGKVGLRMESTISTCLSLFHFCNRSPQYELMIPVWLMARCFIASAAFFMWRQLEYISFYACWSTKSCAHYRRPLDSLFHDRWCWDHIVPESCEKPTFKPYEKFGNLNIRSSMFFQTTFLTKIIKMACLNVFGGIGALFEWLGRAAQRPPRGAA